MRNGSSLATRLTRLEAHQATAESEGPTIAQWQKWWADGRVGTLPGLTAEAEARQRLAWLQVEETMALFDDEEDLS